MKHAKVLITEIMSCDLRLRSFEVNLQTGVSPSQQASRTVPQVVPNSSTVFSLPGHHRRRRRRR